VSPLSPTRLAALAALPFLFISAALAQDAAPAPAAFPGGARSITEAHGDWELLCGLVAQARTCLVTQTLADEQNGQRLLSVELEPSGAGAATGTLLLPFGLLLTEGIRIQADAAFVGEARPFQVCYEHGCHVNLVFNQAEMELLRRGNAINFIGKLADSGETITLSASLSGIANALGRALALTSE